jgi:hypothetical protein
MTSTLTRKSLGTQIREALESRGLPVVVGNLPDGRLCYEIDGQKVTPGDAAKRLGIEW